MADMRSHFCGQVDESLVGLEVTVCGWVHRRRDHGGVIFIDLRDREGLVQIVIDPDTPTSFALAEQVRSEYVLRAEGRVRHRPEGTVNPDRPTGKVEILVAKLEILNTAKTPPFQPDDQPRDLERAIFGQLREDGLANVAAGDDP